MKPNIFLLILDSLRADKCFGPNKKTITPNIDSLIKKGTYFDQAVSAAGQTIPSVSSLLSGVYSFKSTLIEVEHYTLNPVYNNLTKFLKNQGYQTIAYVPDHFPLVGLSRDFEVVKTFHPSSTIYDGVGDEILKIQDSNKHNEPWFFYTHLLDLHGSAGFVLSKGPDEFHDENFGINQYDRMLYSLDNWLGKIFTKINFENTLLILTADHGSEDGVHTPEMLKRKIAARVLEPSKAHKTASKIMNKLPSTLNPLRSKLREKNLSRRKKILDKRKQDEVESIKTENLSNYEKRILSLAIKPSVNIFDDRVRIPLLFVGYNMKNNIVINNQVQLTDIFPTVAEFINCPLNINSIHGRSILPLLKGNNLEEIPAYLESTTNWTRSISSNVIGIRTSKFKYFRDKDEPTKNINFYDLSKDPLEENNLEGNKEKIAEFEEMISQIRSKVTTKNEREFLKYKVALKKNKLKL